jgi:hypothetical protein
MIVDKFNTYSDAQALTSTGASTDLIDHGSDRNLGMGEPMVVEILLDVAADAGNSDETYSVALQTDDNAGFSSPTTIGTATITRGDAAGTRYVISVPPNTAFERYSRLNFTLAGTTPSVTVTAHLVPQSFVDRYVQYPDAITIS